MKLDKGRATGLAADFKMDSNWFRPPLLDAWYLSGPTAGGKTEVGLELADLLNAEIVSMDSMAIYRGMDIGTAKPSTEQRQRVPHHLIDILDPIDSYSVSQYVKDAHQKWAEIRQKGKEVLFVGGTPLYLKTLIRGMFLGPEADWGFRSEVEEDVARFGISSLRDRLRQVDPILAHKLLDGDVRRMTRALEVAKLTGRPLSHWQSQFERSHRPEDCRLFVLDWERQAIHSRVNHRVERMFRDGLVDEVRRLMHRFDKLGRTAAQAVGYRETMMYLEAKQSLEETIQQVQAHTRQFVRKQEIWFRSMREITRVSVTSGFDARSVALQMVQQPRSS